MSKNINIFSTFRIGLSEFDSKGLAPRTTRHAVGTASEGDFLALEPSPLRRNWSYHCVRLCHTCHYVCGGRRAPDRPPARHIGRAQSISTRRQMTSL
jgi:hypothetical protein